MENSVSNRIEVELSRQYGDGMDVESMVDGLVSLWQQIDAVLHPVLGQRGVAALYQRSLYLSARTYPWLASSHDGTQTSIDFVHLKSLLINQQAADLIAGSTLLFKTFHELLVNLVGPALTERLLSSVSATIFSGSSAQDYS